MAYFQRDDEEFIVYDNTKLHLIKQFIARNVYHFFFNLTSVITRKKKAVEHKKITVLPQIGSDEVGFGDFFGPLVVVSAYIDEDNYERVLKLGVTDSKKLKDDQIVLIATELVKFVPYKRNIVNNDKYNSLIREGYNMNKNESNASS